MVAFNKILQGYSAFREKYASGDHSVMQYLSLYGQRPTTMVVACCDSRVDPALILQCDPGDLFVVRNVANIIPPYEKDGMHHGTSAALEFGICFLEVDHLIILGHSQCGGIQALLHGEDLGYNDFIHPWVSLIETEYTDIAHTDDCARDALHQSYAHCLTFPWIKEAVEAGRLVIHLWFFDIKAGQIYSYSDESQDYQPLDLSSTR